MANALYSNVGHHSAPLEGMSKSISHLVARAQTSENIILLRYGRIYILQPDETRSRRDYRVSGDLL